MQRRSNGSTGEACLRRARLRPSWLAAVSGALALSSIAPAVAHAAPPARPRELPRPHRFRLGLELDYVRLSVAMDPNTGGRQQFHFVPMTIDFAYQAQFLKYVMVRPSLGLGVNAANTFEAMPAVVHPQIHAGYQGALFGASFGYGYVWLPVALKDVRSTVRGGQGRPIIERNHHIGVEASVTSRIHRRRASAPGAGAFTFSLQLGAMKSRLLHFDVEAHEWRFMFSAYAGWFFGDGGRREARRRRKQAGQHGPPQE